MRQSGVARRRLPRIVSQHWGHRALSNIPESRGEGPGAKSRDGSSVELYLRLPHRGEIDLVGPSIIGPDVLELGCAAGRLTKPLLERGYRVTAVDNSAEMLEHVPAAANRIRSNIEDLRLGPGFDTVLLASCLINAPSIAQRSALLAACRRHLRVGGVLVFERHDPEWLSSAAVGHVASIDDLDIHIDRIERHADHVEMSVRYASPVGEWSHHFTTELLNDEQLTAELIAANFDSPSWINRRWGKARNNAG
ncbi:MAG: class I SAM-dependent methyltransferase [Betaproteobacteria bacterium]|nr:class I SAM-dependent methyltransferase [Betaproteobacteria bacterium]